MAYPETFGTSDDYRQEIRERAYAPADSQPASQDIVSTEPQVQSQTASSNASPGSSGGSGTTSGGAFTASTEAPMKLSVGTYQQKTDQPYNSLFSSLSGGVAKSGQELGSLVSTFGQKAGDRRTYEGIGGQSLLDAALGAQANDAAKGQAKGLVQASYSGPTSLREAASKPEDVDALQGRIQDLGSQATALGSLGGIEALLTRQAPGLTGGQAREEGRSLLGDVGFRKEASGARADASRLLADYNRVVPQAGAYAEARKGEEADIAKKARDYLTTKKTGVLSGLDAQVAQAQKEHTAATQGYADALSSHDLSKIPLANRDFTEEQLANTPGNKLAAEANAALQSIMAKYPTLKDIPVLTPRINSHGKEVLDLPDDYWKTHQGDHTAEEWKKIKADARIRQEELAKSGFSLRATGTFQPTQGNGAWDGTPTAGWENYGKYAPVASMDWGADIGPYTGPDVSQYLTFDPGISPSRENVSSAQQRQLVKDINDILDVQADDIQEPTEQLRHAMVKLDMDRYLADEEAQLKARAQTLTSEDKAWLDAVVNARNRFKKEQENSSFFGSLGNLDPLGAVDAAVGTNLGGGSRTDLSAFTPTFAAQNRGTFGR